MSIAADQRSACFQVVVTDDAIFDPNEVFEVSVSVAGELAVVRQGLGSAQITIVDDDPADKVHNFLPDVAIGGEATKTLQ